RDARRRTIPRRFPLRASADRHTKGDDMFVIRCSLLALLVLAGLPAHAADAAAPVSFEWGMRIPLRDGVELSATLYRPRDQAAPLPCVFTLTPYIAQSYHERGMYFAANGYVF